MNSRRRVVSLVPSITETLLAWGITPIGVTRFCDAPGVVAVGGTKNPDLAAITALDPDVVLMDQEENRRDDADALAEAGLTVHATDVRSIADVSAALDGIARLLGAGGRVEAMPERHGGPVFFRAWIPIWRRPWMTLGAATYATSLLAWIGVENVFAREQDPYPQVDLDTVRDKKPHLVLAPSEPYPFSERHRVELEQVAPVVFVDGQDLFWWGARTPAAAERLRKLACRLARSAAPA